MARSIRPLVSLALAMVGMACGSAAARDQETLLDDIKARGTMRVCQAEYAPWNMKNPITQEWEGIDVDIVKIVAAQLKVKVENVDATFSTIVPNMLVRKCDLAGVPLFVTPSRAEQISYTRSFGQDGLTLFVGQSSKAKTVEDLDKPGTTIVVRSGNYEEIAAKRLFKKATVKIIVAADSAGIQLLAVGAGRADAALAAYYGNRRFLKSNPSLKVKLASEGSFVTKSSIAYAVPAREYFFRDYLNATLLTLEDNGQIEEIFDKWFK